MIKTTDRIRLKSGEDILTKLKCARMQKKELTAKDNDDNGNDNNGDDDPVCTCQQRCRL